MIARSACLTWICITGLFFTTFSQYYYYNNKYYDNDILFEAGLGIGGMNCLTDLGGKKGTGRKFIKDINLKNSKPGFGVYGTLLLKNLLGFRLEGGFGTITAYDSILKDVAASTSGRYERSLNFRSKIYEIQIGIEVHPLLFKSSTEHPPLFSPYLLFGVGYFSFNPEANLNGKWYRLQPLCTEGQGFKEYAERRPYRLWQISIPIGGGLKYELSPILNTRIEFIYRILNTDYLDDVSTAYIDPSLFFKYLSPGKAIIAQQLADRQWEKIPGHTTTPGQGRGNPKNKDSFFSLLIKIGFVLGRQKQ